MQQNLAKAGVPTAIYQSGAKLSYQEACASQAGPWAILCSSCEHALRCMVRDLLFRLRRSIDRKNQDRGTAENILPVCSPHRNALATRSHRDITCSFSLHWRHEAEAGVGCLKARRGRRGTLWLAEENKVGGSDMRTARSSLIVCGNSGAVEAIVRSVAVDRAWTISIMTMYSVAQLQTK